MTRRSRPDVAGRLPRQSLGEAETTVTDGCDIADPVERLLSRLSDVHASAANQWSARCPAHDDRHSSLSVTRGNTKRPGAAVVHCWAGCPAAKVAHAVGLTLDELDDWSPRRGHVVERRHVYEAADGEPLYAVERTRRDDGRSWRYSHPVTGSGWVVGRGDGPRKLYRLPDLLRNPDLDIWFSEGERDADTLAAAGLVATTVASGSWRDVDLTPITGRLVHIVVDNDRAGWKRGRETMARVQRAGGLITEVLRPPDAYKDVTALVSSGRPIGELSVVDLDAEAPPCEQWGEPPPVEPFEDASGRAFFAMLPKRVLRDRTLSDRAVRVLGMLDEKAGASGLARATIADLAEWLGVKKWQAAKNATAELVAAGYLQPVRRGWWRVLNPSRDNAEDRETPFLHKTPTQTPANHTERYESEGSPITPHGHVQRNPTMTVRGDSDVAQLVVDAFPGAEIEP